MASVASQLIQEVTAHAQSDSFEDAREVCADGTYPPNNLRSIIIVSHLMEVETKFITVDFAIRLQDSHHLHLVGWNAVKVACLEFARGCSEKVQAL